MKMVREMYGAQAYMDAMNHLIGQAYEKAVQEAGLKVAGAPEITPKGEIKEGADPQFTATVEVFPEVETPDLKDVELKRFVCEVTDTEVEKTLEIMRKQRATYEVEENGVAAEEKRVTINFVGKLDGTPFEGGTANGFAFVIGAGQMLPDFEKGVTGMKTGEKKTVYIFIPQFYPDAIFTLTQDAEGDATVFDLNGTVAVTDISDDDGTRSIFYEIREKSFFEEERKQIAGIA